MERPGDGHGARSAAPALRAAPDRRAAGDHLALLRALLLARSLGPEGAPVDPREGILLGSGRAVATWWRDRGARPDARPWVLGPDHDGLAVGLGATARELLAARHGDRLDPGRRGRGHGAPAIPRLRLVGTLAPDPALGAGLALGAGRADAHRGPSRAAVAVVVDLAPGDAAPGSLAMALRLARAHDLGLVVVTVAASTLAGVARTLGADRRDADGDDPADVLAVVHAALDEAARGGVVVVAAREGTDPAARLAGDLADAGVVDQPAAARLRHAVDAELDAARLALRGATRPPAGELLVDPVRAVPPGPPPVAGGTATPGTDLPVRAALDAALARRGEVDGRLVELADPAADPAALVRAAMGAAVAGARPVVRLDAAGIAASLAPLRDAAALRWRSGGAWSAPLVVVGPEGARASAPDSPVTGPCGAVPGLTVIAPASAADAAAVVVALGGWREPAVVLVGDGPAAPGLPPVAIGRARVARPGTDVTVVAWGGTVATALAAAAAVDADAEVVDLVTVAPFDLELVVGSVRCTGRLVVVGDETPAGSRAAAVVAAVAAAVPLAVPPVALVLADLPALPPLGERPALAALVVPGTAAVERALAAVTAPLSER